jgi:ankyrin repeat protein
MASEKPRGAPVQESNLAPSSGLLKGPPSAINHCATGERILFDRAFRGWVDHFGTPTSLTPAHLVSYFGLHTAIGPLLARGLDMTLEDSDGVNPLCMAANMGHVAFIAELLMHLGNDAGVDSPDSSGRTPLSFAAAHGHLAAVKLLVGLSTVDLNSRCNRLGRTPLSFAAGKGHCEVLTLLIATGKAEVDSRDKFGRTPLSYASENGHTEVVNILVAAGAEVGSKDGASRTPLRYASAQCHTGTIKALLHHGADGSVTDIALRGCLHELIPYSNCDVTTAKMLIKAGAPTLTADMRDMTPLHYTVRQGRQDIAELLLGCGVPIDITVKDGREQGATAKCDSLAPRSMGLRTHRWQHIYGKILSQSWSGPKHRFSLR